MTGGSASHSRAFLLRAYPLQAHEMLFDAHWHAFRVFGGVPGRGIYDSEALAATGSRPCRTKTAVDRVGRGKQRDVNARFKAMHCPAGELQSNSAERGQPLRL
ncbi:hypothetical protein C8N42_1221 [Celeribacter persicus]|uniref:Transposase n=1 Tax=Celeribacter persicus TaxID=1651082 RepID=A0A2T5H5F4_9RHOB|nr:hypothetical protein C8N42_1221 [Celeribacter persicus]